MNIKFKKIARHLYVCLFNGFLTDYIIRYISPNWSICIWNGEEWVKHSSYPTLRDCKLLIKDRIERSYIDE